MADYVGGTDRLFFDLGKTQSDAIRQSQVDYQNALLAKMQLDESSKQNIVKNALDMSKFNLDQENAKIENNLKNAQTGYYFKKANEVASPEFKVIEGKNGGIYTVTQNNDGSLKLDTLMAGQTVKDPTFMNSSQGIFSVSYDSNGKPNGVLVPGTGPKVKTEKQDKPYITLDNGKSFATKTDYMKFLDTTAKDAIKIQKKYK